MNSELADTPAQWSKATLQYAIVRFSDNPKTLEKEELLTMAGQLQRYGGEYYMGVAREVRKYLYAHFELVTPSGTHI